MRRRSVRVLIIDDTATIVAYLRQALLKLGYSDENIFVAYDGVSGLEQFYLHQPACVIVDVKMPGLDGYQVVRSIRGDKETANTPLIILSALQEHDQRLTGLLSGADAYLKKPLKLLELEIAIDRAMEISPENRAARMLKLANEE